ncbi:hypothetical protein BH11GEM1_BH11GEM1_10660 [soil metagenome]
MHKRRSITEAKFESDRLDTPMAIRKEPAGGKNLSARDDALRRRQPYVPKPPTQSTA